MKPEVCHTFFDLLSIRSRLDIILALRDGPKSVAEICERVKVERTNVSHQLKLLRECSFIFQERRGKRRVYSLNTETVVPILQLVEFHIQKYCPLKPERGRNPQPPCTPPEG